MMKCETCRELMMEYVQGELAQTRAAEVEAHLDQCVGCRKELESVRKVLSVINAADQPAIHGLVSEMIEQAIQPGCSDIHIQPLAEQSHVRYRIDGVLRDVSTLPKEQHGAVVARIKIMADMDTMETKVPQDGRIRVQIEEKEYDLRVSCLPTILGESVVMRILSPPDALPDLDAIGMSEHNRELFDEMLGSSHGLLVVTGPTGSGKTTTLYAALAEVNRREVSVATIEDPVEIIIDGVNQVAVNPRAGVTFPAAMRQILRQDPDVIMCGEIRSLDGLQMAITAAMTGHLVMTVLHTNEAAAVMRRMIDVGAERFLVGETLLGALAQRLIRKLCPDCRQAQQPTANDMAWLEAAGIAEIPEQVWSPAGCEKCSNTGYRGRAAVHEIWLMDDEIRQMLTDGTEIEHIERMVAHKIVPMRHDAAQKVIAGITSMAEVKRVLGPVAFA